MFYFLLFLGSSVVVGQNKSKNQRKNHETEPNEHRYSDIKILLFGDIILSQFILR